MLQKKGEGTRRLVFLTASPLVTAPQSNLIRLYYNGSAAKFHSTTTHSQVAKGSDLYRVDKSTKLCMVVA